MNYKKWIQYIGGRGETCADASMQAIVILTIGISMESVMRNLQRLGRVYRR